MRGGSWYDQSGLMASSNSNGLYYGPANESSSIGFRVAAVPEPSTLALFWFGTAGNWRSVFAAT